MASLNLRRSSKDKDIVVGRFKPDGRCKKHPKHRQSPGVCSLCLRDRLVQLSSSSSSKTTSATAGSSCSSSLSSYYSSSSASSCASPILHHPLPFTTKGKRSSSVSIFLLSAKHGLVKSRSMAVVPRRRKDEGGVDDHSKKSDKKNGFWSKLLRPKSKRILEEEDDKVVVRSRSLRETVTVAG